MYTVDYFIKKFEAIPEDLWITGSDGWKLINGKGCALGFCKPEDLEQAISDIFWENRILLFEKYGYPSQGVSCQRDYELVYCINDALLPELDRQSNTPKARILAALYDIKKLQQGEVKPVEIKSEFIPVTFKEIKIPEHSIN